jgi:hypothetical protein
MSNAAPTGFWSRLTPRERTLIMALVLTFFVMGTLLLFYLRASTLRESRNEIDAYRLALESVYTRGSVYQERLEAKKKRESNIATDEIQFLTLIEEAQAGIDGLTVSDQEEGTPMDLGDGLVKRTFKFKLRSVSLEDALKFLTDIESRPGRIILTEQMLIRSPSATEDRLNVDVEVATWERRSADEPVADEEAEEP